MAAKQLVFDENARRALERGANAVARAVKATLGPRGRNVVLDKKWGSPTITKEVANVASIAGNDRQVGQMIADAMDKVGKDGVITVEESKGTTDSLEVVEGMQFDKGYISAYMVTDPERMEARYENPLILIHEKK